MINSCVSQLRSNFKAHILNNTVEQFLPPLNFTSVQKFPKSPEDIHRLPKHSDTLIRYFYLFQCSMIFAENNYNPNRIVNNRPFHAKVPHPRREEVIHEPSLLVISDANKCNLFLCIVAWLTIDDFRWHKIYPSVPEDLSYGLVLQYPDYILSCVEFVYHRKKLYGMDILPPIVENCEQFVKSNYSF